MRSLIIVNDAPYGSERCYNALRVAHALQKREDAHVDVFLMADAVAAARAGQQPAEGYYNIEHMVKRVLMGKGLVLLCGTCMEARGLTVDGIVEGARVSNMAELAEAIASADKVLNF